MQTHALPALDVPDATFEALTAVGVALSSAREVVCCMGAGCSTSAGIPDFRGSTGLYSSSSSSSPPLPSSSPAALPPLPTYGPQSTRLLFSYASLLRPDTRSQHLAFLCALHRRARAIRAISAAEGRAPTAFHELMGRLNEADRLLRVWSQNVDGLEGAGERGLGFVDLFAEAGGMVGGADGEEESGSEWEDERATRRRPQGRKRRRSSAARADSPAPAAAAEEASTRGKVVALHGTLGEVVCSVCGAREKWKKRHSRRFKRGEGAECGRCEERQQTRVRACKRRTSSASQGFLRPAVLLYDDPTLSALSASAAVSALLDADLSGASGDPPDFLLVAGTTLRIPGFRGVVKDCARAVRERGGMCVMVNRESVGKEWESVFDFQFIGDTDNFAQHMLDLLSFFSTPPTAEPRPTSPLAVSAVPPLPTPLPPPSDTLSTTDEPPPPPKRVLRPRKPPAATQIPAEPPSPAPSSPLLSAAPLPSSPPSPAIAPPSPAPARERSPSPPLSPPPTPAPLALLLEDITPAELSLLGPAFAARVPPPEPARPPLKSALKKRPPPPGSVAGSSASLAGSDASAPLLPRGVKRRREYAPLYVVSRASAHDGEGAGDGAGVMASLMWAESARAREEQRRERKRRKREKKRRRREEREGRA